MRFLVFGAGAVGSLVGGCLAREHEVTLVARRAHVDAIRRDGLEVRGRTRLRTRPRAVASVDEVASEPAPDAVLLTVKSYDTAGAVEALEPFLGVSLFLSLQNGLGNLEVLAERAERVLGGVTYNGVTFTGPGVVDHAGRGETVIGPWKGTHAADAERVAGALTESHLATGVTPAIAEALWTKAVVNACFNPLTALLRLPSGALAERPSLEECCRAIVGEAVAVAATRGVSLDGESLLRRVGEVARATARNRSSMLQDLERGRRTEIDAINGAIARLGEEGGLDCPVNRTLTLLVRAAGEG
ncbi:MAG: 2-dehydropantoate 2-reductase [Gemmatimonadetes bacterium]|nr:2-dehydropantoate 2-reductase [Gemmatimonadota bacterium]